MELLPGKYRHFKGKEYQLLGVAAHSETLEPMVVYRALYGDGGLWVRPAAMWQETVERDGYRGPRFQYIGPNGTRTVRSLGDCLKMQDMPGEPC